MNPDVGPRCGECRMGLGVHNTADPLCEAREDLDMDQLGDAPADVVDAWCRHVDAAVAGGTDPFNAVVEADQVYRGALQASLDRD